MGAMLAVVDLEIGELSLQIMGVPEQCVIKKLSANASDQPFDKRMRSRHVGNALDFLDIQNSCK